MKVLNRNQQLAVGCPMRGVRAVIVCLLAALALSGCVHTASPVATAQPQSDLDAMAYGGPAYYPAPAATVAPSANSDADTGGLRYRLPARCRRQIAGRGLRPGRPHQYLCDRCRRLHHHAADRLG